MPIVHQSGPAIDLTGPYSRQKQYYQIYQTVDVANYPITTYPVGQRDVWTAISLFCLMKIILS